MGRGDDGERDQLRRAATEDATNGWAGAEIDQTTTDEDAQLLTMMASIVERDGELLDRLAR